MRKKQLTKLQFWLIYGSVIVAGILIDQLTKILLEDVLKNGDIPIIGDWLQLSWTLNTGSAFGNLKGASVLFFIVTIVGLPLFCWLLYRSYSRGVWGQIGYSFVISGAIGNAIDRAFLGDGFFNGAVRDLIYVKGFAIFNVADSFLTVGVIMAIIALLFTDRDALIKEIIAENNRKKPHMKNENEQSEQSSNSTENTDTLKPNTDNQDGNSFVAKTDSKDNTDNKDDK